jgi:hypothetical protein
MKKKKEIGIEKKEKRKENTLYNSTQDQRSNSFLF